MWFICDEDDESWNEWAKTRLDEVADDIDHNICIALDTIGGWVVSSDDIYLYNIEKMLVEYYGSEDDGLFFNIIVLCAEDDEFVLNDLFVGQI